MASLGNTVLLLLVAACLCLAYLSEAREVSIARRSTFAGTTVPVGWWHSLKPKNGSSWCGLRDFPPRGSGSGASILYCVFPTYDHYWMWRVQKVNSPSSSLSSGDEVFLSMYNPVPFKFCQLKSRVMCGYANGTRFVIEKANGTGQIDLSRDDVLLRVGTGYCSLRGTGHAQTLTCVATRALATVFQFPASSFAYTQLVNDITTRPCGGYFYPMPPRTTDTVSCNFPNFVGFATNVTLALQTPGAPLISAGTPVAFKTYDDKYTYHVTTWVQRNTTVYYAPEETLAPGQWFTMERTSGPVIAGSELQNGTQVVLRSTLGSKPYCGQPFANTTALVCDVAGPISTLPLGYTYTYVIMF